MCASCKKIHSMVVNQFANYKWGRSRKQENGKSCIKILEIKINDKKTNFLYNGSVGTWLIFTKTDSFMLN